MISCPKVCGFHIFASILTVFTTSLGTFPVSPYNSVRIAMKRFIVACVALGFFSCTQETQNKIGRGIQNWTGTDGILEIYSGGKLVKRFMKIDKLSTAVSTSGKESRNYRYGYGYLDENQNGSIEKNEKKKVYFEVGGFTDYLFYEDPN